MTHKLHIDRMKTKNLIDCFFSLFRLNITFKLTIGFTCFFIVIMLLLNGLFFIAINAWAYMEAEKELAAASDLIKQSRNLEVLSSPVLDLDKMQYFIYSEPNKKLVSTNSNEKIRYFQHSKTLKLSDYPPKWIYYEKAHNKEGQLIVVRKNITQEYQTILFFTRIAQGVSLFFIIVVFIWAAELTTKHLSPIHIMTRKVKEITVKNLSTRLDVSGTRDELKDLADVFNRMMDEIENSYEQQKQFVSDASHELKTPIAVIKGYASMVNRWGKDDPSVLAESLQSIEEEARNMQSLVESLLFLARRDKGTLEMEKEVFNAKGFMEEIIKETQLIDTQHIITTNLEYDGDIYASHDKLKQAIRIFLDNSIKYTPEGGVIEVGLKASNKDAYIIIKDNGIGISKEDLPHIFERFFRADQARTRIGKGGSGLGLAIAEVIIEQHDGKISVESEESVGTTVTVILPLGIFDLKILVSHK